MRKQSKLFWFFVITTFVVGTIAVSDLLHGDFYHGCFGAGATIGCWIGAILEYAPDDGTKELVENSSTEEKV